MLLINVVAGLLALLCAALALVGFVRAVHLPPEELDPADVATGRFVFAGVALVAAVAALIPYGSPGGPDAWTPFWVGVGIAIALCVVTVATVLDPRFRGPGTWGRDEVHEGDLRALAERRRGTDRQTREALRAEGIRLRALRERFRSPAPLPSLPPSRHPVHPDPARDRRVNAARRDQQRHHRRHPQAFLAPRRRRPRESNVRR